MILISVMQDSYEFFNILLFRDILPITDGLNFNSSSGFQKNPRKVYCPYIPQNADVF